MIVSNIEKAAEESGVIAIVSNSSDRIENQLNKITGAEEQPILLISWDIDSTISFDQNGFLDPPKANIIALLMDKAEENTAEKRKEKVEELIPIFHTFLQKLYGILVHFNVDVQSPPITNAGYTENPVYGAGKHSGLLCRWTMISKVNNCS